MKNVGKRLLIKLKSMILSKLDDNNRLSNSDELWGHVTEHCETECLRGFTRPLSPLPAVELAHNLTLYLYKKTVWVTVASSACRPSVSPCWRWVIRQLLRWQPAIMYLVRIALEARAYWHGQNKEVCQHPSGGEPTAAHFSGTTLVYLHNWLDLQPMERGTNRGEGQTVLIITFVLVRE